MWIVIYGLVFLNLAHFGGCVVKIWNKESDIFNPYHWADGKPAQQCDGLDMSALTNEFLVLDKLAVKQVILSKFTSLYLLEGARIELDEDGLEGMNCVRLKDNFEAYSWNDPKSWTTEGAEHNEAVPHLDRVPCIQDDVVFPMGWKSSPCLDTEQSFVKSFKFGTEYLNNTDIQDFRTAIPIFSQYPEDLFMVTGSSCTDPTGCQCGNIAGNLVCDYVDEPQRYDCDEPFAPMRFCTKICGATIVLKYTPSFRIARIKNMLKDYSSQTHVGKMWNGAGDTVIQIVFTEKQFSGASLDEAKELRSLLLSDHSFGVAEAVLTTSGSPFMERETGMKAMGIVMGSLCGVIVVFGIIFFVNSPNFNRFNLRTRYHFSTAPLSALLAKYEKMDDRENLEKAESVLSLEKSFDNPMYGQPAPSTAGTSKITSSINRTTTSEIHLENPLYEVDTDDNLNESPLDDFHEENQLVDLTPLKDVSKKNNLVDLTPPEE